MMQVQTGDEKKKPAMPTSGESKSHTKPQMTAPMAGMDHKAAIAKMHPEHLHAMVQHAMSGKAGPEMQQMAQKAMTAPPTGGSPTQDSGMSGETNNSPKGNPFMGGPAEEEPEEPQSRASMFAGSRSM